MAIESSTELDFFFSTDEFTLDTTYTAAEESSATIPVLFDKPFNSGLLDTGEMDVEGNTPTCLCKSSDVSATAHGDVIAISGTTYHVVGVKADSGSGYQNTTLLVLEQQ
mgnify:CR=1 FL=1